MDEKQREQIRKKVRLYSGRENLNSPTDAEKKAFLDSLKESAEKGELLKASEKSDTDTDPFR